MRYGKTTPIRNCVDVVMLEQEKWLFVCDGRIIFLSIHMSL